MIALKKHFCHFSLIFLQTKSNQKGEDEMISSEKTEDRGRILRTGMPASSNTGLTSWRTGMMGSQDCVVWRGKKGRDQTRNRYNNKYGNHVIIRKERSSKTTPRFLCGAHIVFSFTSPSLQHTTHRDDFLCFFFPLVHLRVSYHIIFTTFISFFLSLFFLEPQRSQTRKGD
mmetsp:Transcript_30757/g.80476  ORF Transcript_30757/g.80476 Transcript_30757/m.80476 type:complete len:171 (-) Transcript_30757:1399-1911(-)